MTFRRVFLSVLMLGTSFASSALASEHRLHARPTTYYAQAPDDATAGDSQGNARPDCFASYTSADTVRGLRHWTGRCH
jgi:hypothetical protein